MQPIEKIANAALCTSGGKIIAVARPGRHGDVIKMMVGDLGYSREDVGYSVQGFTTTAARFVGRSVAFLIARDALQLKPETKVLNGLADLFSEDIW